MEHANRVAIPMRLIVTLPPSNVILRRTHVTPGPINVTPGPTNVTLRRTNVTFYLTNASPQPDQRHAVSPRES